MQILWGQLIAFRCIHSFSHPMILQFSSVQCINNCHLSLLSFPFNLCLTLTLADQNQNPTCIFDFTVSAINHNQTNVTKKVTEKTQKKKEKKRKWCRHLRRKAFTPSWPLTSASSPYHHPLILVTTTKISTFPMPSAPTTTRTHPHPLLP